MTRNISLDKSDKAKPAQALSELLSRINPARASAIHQVKYSLLAAGFLFGVIVFAIFMTGPNPDLSQALTYGAVVSAVGIAMEYVVWKFLVRSLLRRARKEADK